MEKGNNKVYVLFAGVNGAGKSTMYEVLGSEIEGVRINSDEILLKLPTPKRCVKA